ncbi:hypothetical protein LMG7974_01184 [Campylobacter majalis]|uniref:Uncharacterized protein n=1 Tax=Campylobacter majalis TaxID=2790656 RepID=A0ABM8Q7R8_9BACT|nr:hypothetical protein LMG7974_01184 [Campylobacter majalis]
MDLRYQKKYYNKLDVQELLNGFFNDRDVKIFTKLDFVHKVLLIAVYSWDMLPTLNYNSKFLKFIGEHDIKLSHDLYIL